MSGAAAAVAAAVASITIETVVTGAAIGAAMGGISAAIQGGDIGMGILGGAVGGAVTGGLGQGLGSFIGAEAGTFGGVATGALSTAAGGAVNSAITGADPLNGALMGAVTGGIAGGLGAFDKAAAAQGLDSASSQGYDALQASQMAAGELPQGPTPSGLTLDAMTTQPQAAVSFVPDAIKMTEIPASATDLAHGDLVQQAADALKNGSPEFGNFPPQIQEAARSLVAAKEFGGGLSMNNLTPTAAPMQGPTMSGLTVDQAAFANVNPAGNAMTSNAAQNYWDINGNGSPVGNQNPGIQGADMGYAATQKPLSPLQQNAKAWGSRPVDSLWNGGTTPAAGANGAVPPAEPWGQSGISWVDTPVNWVQNHKLLSAAGGLSLLGAMGGDSSAPASAPVANPTGTINPTFNKPLQQYGYLQPSGSVTQYRQVSQRPGGLSSGQTWGYNAQGQMVPVSTDANGNLIQAQGMKAGGAVHGGQDDRIPILGAAGEYMIPADVVSGLGDGYSDAGAKKLDHLVANVRQHKGAPKKLPKKSKPTAAGYLRSA